VVFGNAATRRNLTAVVDPQQRFTHLERYTTMRAILVPAAIAATLALAPVAFAAQTATGTIKTIDATGHKLTMSDGTVYMLPKDFKTSSLKPGEKVTVTFDTKGANHEASSVTPAK
jgi:Cu/Ag efflux protein CusF